MIEKAYQMNLEKGGYALRQLPPFDILGKGLEDSFVIVWKRGVKKDAS